MQTAISRLKQSKRIVVKVGTSSLTYSTGRIHLRQIDLLARVLSDLRHEGREVVLVTSGAVGVGMGKLGLAEKPKTLREKQAASAIGQSELMSIYGKLFSEYGCDVAQILLTGSVMDDPQRKENAVTTFNTLLEWGIIPIVNENDAISTEELKFGDIGDNDTLSAMVAKLIQADLLILLSDIDGLYSADPRKDENAQLVEEVDEITEDLLQTAGSAGTSRGTGGMLTKLTAAKSIMEAGINMVIANGQNPGIVYDIIEGKRVGTLFKGRISD
ncbi:MAG: glutamate 5-kinase [Ruminococcaceae bacterium]|nr:glutamate 5-kinase [Oscillospiraceae bacterium]